jgi:RHS repeat-associated protein
MVKIFDASNTLLETYTYGASRNRLKTETALQRTYHAWGGNSPVVEYTEPVASSTPTYFKSYVYAGSRLVSTARNYGGATEAMTYHHPDRLGTGLITDDGYGYERNSTLPFGQAFSETSSQTNQPFTSYDRSTSTGLDYAVNRTYSQGQSRFTQVDPIGMAATQLGNPQSNNLYGYVQNMPADFVDPTGLNMECGFRTIIQTMCVGNECSIVDVQVIFVCTSSGGGGAAGLLSIPAVEAVVILEDLAKSFLPVYSPTIFSGMTILIFEGGITDATNRATILRKTK